MIINCLIIVSLSFECEYDCCDHKFINRMKMIQFSIVNILGYVDINFLTHNLTNLELSNYLISIFELNHKRLFFGIRSEK